MSKLAAALFLGKTPCHGCQILGMASHEKRFRVENMHTLRLGNNDLPCALELNKSQLNRMKYAHSKLLEQVEEIEASAKESVTSDDSEKLHLQIDGLSQALYLATSLLVEFEPQWRDMDCPLLKTLFYYEFEGGLLPMRFVVPKSSNESFLKRMLNVLYNNAICLLGYMQVRLLSRKMASRSLKKVDKKKMECCFLSTRHYGFPKSLIEVYCLAHSKSERVILANWLTDATKNHPERYIGRQEPSALFLQADDEAWSQWYFRVNYIDDGRVDRGEKIGSLHYLIVPMEESEKVTKAWKQNFEEKYGRYLAYLSLKSNSCHFVLVFTKMTPLSQAKKALAAFSKRHQLTFIFLLKKDDKPKKDDDVLSAISKDAEDWQKSQKEKSEQFINSFIQEKWQWKAVTNGLEALKDEITHKAMFVLSTPRTEPSPSRFLQLLYEYEQREYMRAVDKLFDLHYAFDFIAKSLCIEDMDKVSEAWRQIEMLSKQIKEIGVRHSHGQKVYEPVKNDKYHEIHNASLFIILCWCMVRELKYGVSTSKEEVKRQVRLLKMALNIQEKQGINSNNKGKKTRQSSRKTYKTKSQEDALKDKVEKLFKPKSLKAMLPATHEEN